MDVLIVEDSDSARLLLEYVASERKHTVTAVRDAETALKLLKEHAFDLLVCDWELPGMSGIDLCRLLRALPAGDEPFVLLATGRGSAEDIEVGLTAGADDYLPKPYAREPLRTRFAVAERAVRQRQEKNVAERARRRSDRRLGQLIDRSPVGIAHASAKTRRITEGNGEFARLIGVTSIAGASLDLLLQLVASDARERLQRALQAETKSEPFALRRPSGEIGHVLLSTARYDEDDGESLLLILHDVAEREQLRAQLVVADRLTSVGTLAAGVAHEINNPLAYTMSNIHFASEVLRALQPDLKNASLSFSNLFSRFGVVDPVEAAIEALGDAQHGSERVRNIVSQLREFSRSEGERLELVSVTEVIDGALTLVANEIRHRARLEVHYGQTGTILANRSKLGQVVVNLLINAAQAIEGSAADNIITVTTRAADKGVEIEVSDTGVGIAPEHLPRIFEPFFTTKPVGVGTGLGLSICHTLIVSFGGTIEAISAGRGTKFRVTLPLKSADAEPPKQGAGESTTPPPPRRGRLLVVDDEPAIGRALSRLLGGAHDVVAVTDGREALALLEAGNEFDVIFCDIMMPQMSGMEFYSALSSRERDDIEKLVFITGGAFTPSARRFLDSVENDRLLKPLDANSLRTLINQRLKDN